jgi:hypothetical protein
LPSFTFAFRVIVIYCIKLSSTETLSIRESCFKKQRKLNTGKQFSRASNACKSASLISSCKLGFLGLVENDVNLIALI